MENVLDQYEKPLDPAEPVICVDEQPYQMLDDARPPQPAALGKIAKQDYEYRRCGTCSVFVAVEPKAGKRFVQPRRRRTRIDFARFIRDLLRRYPHARMIHIILDNLNTHDAQSLIEAFGEKEANKLMKRIRWHYTPKHASWLNMAEIEISAMSRQCLDRRLPTFEDVVREAAACSRDRNRQKIKIEWTFRRADARRVFPELYRPTLAG